jgi:hypothetical protein
MVPDEFKTSGLQKYEKNGEIVFLRVFETLPNPRASRVGCRLAPVAPLGVRAHQASITFFK